MLGPSSLRVKIEAYSLMIATFLAFFSVILNLSGIFFKIELLKKLAFIPIVPGIFLVVYFLYRRVKEGRQWDWKLLQRMNYEGGIPVSKEKIKPLYEDSGVVVAVGNKK